MKTCRLLLLLMLWLPLSMASPQDLQYVGSTLWSGMCDIELSGYYAFCVYPNGLAIFNVSDSASPALAGRLFVTGSCTRLDVSGGYAYIACGKEGMKIVDISNPATPEIVSTTQSVGQVNDIFLVGHYAYIADDSLGLNIFDVSNPVSPQFIGNAPGPETFKAYRLLVGGNYAYVGANSESLETTILSIYDISNPLSPSLRDTTSVTVGLTTLSGLGVWENYAFTVSRDAYGSRGSLNSFDISNPDSIEFGSYNIIPYALNDIFMVGNIAYVVAEDFGLFAFDIDDPFHPALLGTYNLLDDYLKSAVVSDGLAYMVGINDLQIINMLNPEEPYLVGSYEASSQPIDLAVAGTHSYVIDQKYFHTVNISDINNPTVTGSCELGGTPTKIYIDGDYAYIANMYQGLQVVNISDPQEPYLAGAFSGNFRTLNVYVRNGHAFIEAYHGIMVLNVEDPTVPRFAAYYEASDIADSYFEGDYAYLYRNIGDFWRYARIEIIDLETPFAPTLISEIDSCYHGTKSIAKWPFLYVINSGRLNIFDISDRAQPRFISRLDSLRYNEAYEISGNYLYLSPSSGLISVVDVSDPDLPVEVLRKNIYQYQRNLVAENGYCYIAARYSFSIYSSDFTSVSSDIELPEKSVILGSYPNPFNANATLEYYLPNDGRVTIEIYNIIGQKIVTLADRMERAGEYKVIWNAGSMPSGVYLARLKANSNSKTIKMVLLK